MHVVGECGVDGPPIACYVEYDKKKEEQRKEDKDGPPFSFIDVKNLMKSVSPSYDNPFHCD